MDLWKKPTILGVLVEIFIWMRVVPMLQSCLVVVTERERWQKIWCSTPETTFDLTFVKKTQRLSNRLRLTNSYCTVPRVFLGGGDYCESFLCFIFLNKLYTRNLDEYIHSFFPGCLCIYHLFLFFIFYKS